MELWFCYNSNFDLFHLQKTLLILFYTNACGLCVICLGWESTEWVKEKVEFGWRVFLFWFVSFFFCCIWFESLRTAKYKPKIRIVLDFGKNLGRDLGKKLRNGIYCAYPLFKPHCWVAGLQMRKRRLISIGSYKLTPSHFPVPMYYVLWLDNGSLRIKLIAIKVVWRVLLRWH